MLRLQHFLAANNWKEADSLTANMILEITNRKEEGWLRDEDMNKVPYDVLSTINQLWIDYSNGHFGFSVQKEIYQRIGVTSEYDQKTWQRFGDTVGWRVNNKWIGQYCAFDLLAPRGHLPVMGVNVYDLYGSLWRGWSIATESWYSEATGWHCRDVESECHRKFSSFMSRFIDCNKSV